MNKQMLALIGAVVAGGGLIGWLSGTDSPADAVAETAADETAPAISGSAAAGRFGKAGGGGAAGNAATPLLTVAEPSQDMIAQRARSVLSTEAARVDAALAEQVNDRAPAAIAGPAPAAGPAMPVAPTAATPMPAPTATPAPGGWGGQGGPQPGGWGVPRS